MSIRGDLKDVEALISRLISIGGEFRAKDKWWAHLKNEEDYSKVWQIQDQAKKMKIESIYCDGRDMELFMSDALESINFDFTKYPTLTSIIEKLTNTWVSQDLEIRLADAIKAHEELKLNNWAFGQMCATFQEQIELAKVVKQTLEHLKESTLYKIENNLPVNTDNPTISISNITNSNIALNSNNVAQNIHTNEELFTKLIDAIKASEIQHKEPLVSVVEEMQQEAKSGSFFNSYKKFMTLAADHMGVLAPFIPLLTELL